MSPATIDTVIKMIESVPESAQDRIVEHLREYIEDMQDEFHWEMDFQKTQPQLTSAARRARQEITAGLAEPLNHDRF